MPTNSPSKLVESFTVTSIRYAPSTTWAFVRTSAVPDGFVVSIMKPDPLPRSVLISTTEGRTASTIEARVGVGVDVGVAVKVGVGRKGVAVGAGIGVGVGVGKGVNVGVGVGVGLASMMASIRASTVASISGVGAGSTVGSAACTRTPRVASISTVGEWVEVGASVGGDSGWAQAEVVRARRPKNPTIRKRLIGAARRYVANRSLVMLRNGTSAEGTCPP